jgi:hypothetical protein
VNEPWADVIERRAELNGTVSMWQLRLDNEAHNHTKPSRRADATKATPAFRNTATDESRASPPPASASTSADAHLIGET